MRLRRYRLPALLVLTLHLVGCYAWEPIPPGVPPGPVIEREEPSQVRVMLIDGSEDRLHDPIATLDSIYDRAHRGYALDDVAAISLRRDQPGGTFLGIAAAAAGVVGVGLLIYWMDQADKS